MMKRYSETQEPKTSSLPEETSPVLSVLLQLLGGDRQTANLISQLSVSFELLEFQLGDVIINLSNPPDNTVRDEQKAQYFYLVCQGKVRLLSSEPEKQREVSTQSLIEGETFGADTLFSQTILPYWAKAATSVRVARISIETLQPWLEKLPKLKEHCLTTTYQRQTLIFFKTLTELKSLPSYRLENLLPYLVEKQVAAGERLSQVTPESAGRFWLHCGQLQSQTLTLGSSWGYPNPTPKEAVAQTALWVYQLPSEYWETAVRSRLY
ncbi:MAG: cyclic nucleotide-binding domain-containing protein [Hydrococcus sp. RM1_1_31]|nr:cyclic nucleotide-binding domain-containing protein [Hydrococcus sp. RM1_1_31]